MRTLNRLKTQARETATWRGHTLSRFKTLHNHEAMADCACGASVYVNDRPPPNGCEVVGDAVAINHPEARQ